jgi:hypothetical protein
VHGGEVLVQVLHALRVGDAAVDHDVVGEGGPVLGDHEVQPRVLAPHPQQQLGHPPGVDGPAHRRPGSVLARELDVVARDPRVGGAVAVAVARPRSAMIEYSGTTPRLGGIIIVPSVMPNSTSRPRKRIFANA